MLQNISKNKKTTMKKLQTKEEALQVLENLPEKVLLRLAELSSNEKAQGYFSCPIKFGAVKGFLS